MYIDISSVKNQKDIYSWCENLEDGAYNQACDVAKLKPLFKHVALMPDCHQGYGMPIGGVAALKHAISPFLVGVDIGCGITSWQTGLNCGDVINRLGDIAGDIRREIPMGMKHNQSKFDWYYYKYAPRTEFFSKRLLDSSRKQMGTLGSGNHYLELQKDDDGMLWVMVHCGSRNFGKKIADYYHQKALEHCHDKGVDLPNDDLAYLTPGSEYFQEYIDSMNFALSFAKKNRSLIMTRVARIIYDHVTKDGDNPVDRNYLTLWANRGQYYNPYIPFIDIHHNYAALENHYGEDVWVHRKGATFAGRDKLGIVSGSQGTPSYIVRGLGKDSSFNSCSHGAGRTMGRYAASRNLSVEDSEKAMEGIMFGGWGTNRKGDIDLGESPLAYKDIGMVMAAQQDLVGIEHKLTPILNLKDVSDGKRKR